MDSVFIKQLQVIANIGVYDWEKSVQQKLFIDLEMAHDNQPAGQADDINLALDYFKVSQAIEALLQGRHFALIETVAEQIATMIMSDFAVPWLKVAVHKPGALAKAATLGVCIERGQR